MHLPLSNQTKGLQLSERGNRSRVVVIRLVKKFPFSRKAKFHYFVQNKSSRAVTQVSVESSSQICTLFPLNHFNFILLSKPSAKSFFPSGNPTSTLPITQEFLAVVNIEATVLRNVTPCSGCITSHGAIIPSFLPSFLPYLLTYLLHVPEFILRS